MFSVDKAPTFDGKGASSQDYHRQVRSRMRMDHWDHSKRLTVLILCMNSVARQVSLSSGGDRLISNDRAMRILDILKNYFAPGAVDSICRGVAHFLQYRWEGQSTDE